MIRYVRIRDAAYGRYLVAGDLWDGCVYHQPHQNRPNAVWAMIDIPNFKGMVELRDLKHGYRLMAGDHRFVPCIRH